MSKANIGWLFYKEMYRNGDNDSHIKKRLNKLLDAKAKDERFNAKHTFVMETIYPGLLIGSGYTHGLSSEEDAKLGFYFDHTTGLPLIQGSSVKGLLRSCFGLEFGTQKDIYKEQKHALIKELLQKEIDVESLAKAIFEGINPDGTCQALYKRDIFLDAYVIRTEDKMLNDDSITPHESPFEDPVPNKMLKLASGVTIQFAFELHDIVDKDKKVILSANEKENLFLKLLLWHGIGAKTNVGYGQFVVDDGNDSTPNRQSNNTNTPLPKKDKKVPIKQPFRRKLRIVKKASEKK